MLINCDIGEQTLANIKDDALMKLIDIANIACGAHAGDKESVAYYTKLAKKYQVKVSAHLSYPDKRNFGRVVLDIDIKTLLNSLDEQYALMPEVKTLKLHGALYNEANINKSLALSLIKWAQSAGIREVLTPYKSCICEICEEEGLHVLNEVFIDRRYIYDNGSLKLSARSNKDALITNVQEAKYQYENFLKEKIQIDGKFYTLKADTACIHSDAPNALEMAKLLCSR
ncbi:LamB/YcsF family protein [Sulfurimonas sp. MAG313]|nr:LamB/YcsF family protein [Sulfurimonas sp. MAG313]MDF1880285.1 LamB/YcsF family protein [Sulfurimonas sp. MAG313]